MTSHYMLNQGPLHLLDQHLSTGLIVERHNHPTGVHSPLLDMSNVKLLRKLTLTASIFAMNALCQVCFHRRLRDYLLRSPHFAQRSKTWRLKTLWLIIPALKR